MRVHLFSLFPFSEDRHLNFTRILEEVLSVPTIRDGKEESMYTEALGWVIHDEPALENSRLIRH